METTKMQNEGDIEIKIINCTTCKSPTCIKEGGLIRELSSNSKPTFYP